MRFNCGADLWPTRGLDPDTAIFYLEFCGGWMFDKFWQLRRPWFPFFATGARDKFRKTRGDERGCVSFAVAFDWRTQELGHAMQDVYGTIFGIAAQTNHCRDVEIEFPKRLRQTVRGPILFLTRNAGARTEITHQIGLGQNDSRRAIHF